jgi:hypothetical protein
MAMPTAGANKLASPVAAIMQGAGSVGIDANPVQAMIA